MTRSPPPRVELFSRAAVAGGRTRQRGVEDRLGVLRDAGRVAADTRHAWQRRVRTPVDGDGPTSEAVAWHGRFAEWAERNGASIEPFFSDHDCNSAFTGTSYEEYVFPVLAVAVVRDREVTEVAPRITCTGEQVDVRDVVDRLDAASTAGAPPPASVAGE